jgi:hypothetical protein
LLLPGAPLLLLESPLLLELAVTVEVEASAGLCELPPSLLPVLPPSLLLTSVLLLLLPCSLLLLLLLLMGASLSNPTCSWSCFIFGCKLVPTLLLLLLLLLGSSALASGCCCCCCCCCCCFAVRRSLRAAKSFVSSSSVSVPGGRRVTRLGSSTLQENGEKKQRSAWAGGHMRGVVTLA